MSRHEIVVNENIYWVVGWDQPLMSFFLQKRNRTLSEDENPILWLGATLDTQMYDMDDLVRSAKSNGLIITREMWNRLYTDRDGGF